MAKIRPFRAVRPIRSRANLVGSRSYISYTDEDLQLKLEGNPYTFLHIINPDHGEPHHAAQSIEEKFKRVRSEYERFVGEGTFKRDETASLYVYRQVKDKHSHIGIIAAISVEDYKEGIIKVHEHTITAREEMFKNYLLETGINAEPVLLAYPGREKINALVEKYTKRRAEYEFTTTDRIEHSLWIIDEESDLEQLGTSFEEVQNLYIADGHHRTASSALLADAGRERFHIDEDSPVNYFMAYLVPFEEVTIYDFNRLVSNIGDHTHETFMEALTQNFTITPKPGGLYKPTGLHDIAMYLGGHWYSLKPKPEGYNEQDAIEHLDCHILSNLLLEPVLGIRDLKTDSRISFLPGDQGMEGLKAKVDAGHSQVAFGLYPVSVNQLRQVSDEGKIMPPKSTYIEPKLRSGLTIYPIFE